MALPPSEVFMAARVAVRRRRAIEEELETLRGLIGVQGHSNSFHGKNGIYDWTGRIDDLDESRGRYAEELAELEKAITEGWSLLMGLASRRVGDAIVTAVTRYYLEGMTHDEVARRMGWDPPEVRRVLRLVMEQCDRIGYARLKEAGFNA